MAAVLSRPCSFAGRLPCSDTELLVHLLATSLYARYGSKFDWNSADAKYKRRTSASSFESNLPLPRYRQVVISMIPKKEHKKRTEEEWVDSIRTEYEAAKKEGKYAAQSDAVVSCLKLATNVLPPPTSSFIT